MAEQQRGKQPDITERWTQHLWHNNKTQSWASRYSLGQKIFSESENLRDHARDVHRDELPADEKELPKFRSQYEAESFQKRSVKDENSQKRSLRKLEHVAPCTSLSELKTLSHEGTQQESGDVMMRDISDDHPRKRAAIGEGISAGSRSPLPFRDSNSPPPRRSKARPTSAPNESTSDGDPRQAPRPFDDIRRPQVEKKQLWTPDQDAPMPRASFDPSNIASDVAQTSKIQAMQNKSRIPFQSPQQPTTVSRSPNPIPSAIFGRAPQPPPQAGDEDTLFDIVLQPETGPISQEQLVAEVKGIYAGLVMVEAKCIEVDNKHATLASTDPGAQPKLNNEQWQARIALHRTLLHEHHDFFLASQHPSASPALRRLASKYAMPARMWRHGIHSFPKLLRHRLPTFLNHMLAFIYLAYSMMAFLYETVPAFEDTLIECLGGLGRYRMAIEDDDIRDREVWTGVARHWYSKASDKALTIGRLCHHMAVLARPNALQQLFYYSKSLSVVVPFTSAKESIWILFEPVLKFIEQGYYIAVSNSIVMLGFASKDNVLVRVISSQSSGSDSTATAVWEDHWLHYSSPALRSLMYDSFRDSEQLHGNTKLASEYSIWLRNLRSKMKLDRNEYVLVSKFLSSVPSEYSLGSLQNGSLQGSTGFQLASHGGLHSGQRLDSRNGLESRVGIQENLNTTSNSTPPLAMKIGTPDFRARLSAAPIAATKPLSQLLVEDCCHLCANTALRPCGLQYYLTTATNISYKFLGWISHLRSPLKAMAFGGLLQVVDALPIDCRPTHAEVYEGKGTDLRNGLSTKDIIPLVKDLSKCAVLIASSHAMLRYADPGAPTNVFEDTVAGSRNKGPKESGVLLVFAGASILGAFYIGIDERVSSFDFALVCACSTVPVFRWINNKLVPFERTAAATGTIITLVAVSSVEAFRQLSPPLKGKYEQPWALHLFGVLPALMLIGWLWEAFVLNLGFAQSFENMFLHLPDSWSQNDSGAEKFQMVPEMTFSVKEIEEFEVLEFQRRKMASLDYLKHAVPMTARHQLWLELKRKNRGDV